MLARNLIERLVMKDPDQIEILDVDQIAGIGLDSMVVMLHGSKLKKRLQTLATQAGLTPGVTVVRRSQVECGDEDPERGEVLGFNPHGTLDTNSSLRYPVLVRWSYSGTFTHSIDALQIVQDRPPFSLVNSKILQARAEM